MVLELIATATAAVEEVRLPMIEPVVQDDRSHDTRLDSLIKDPRHEKTLFIYADVLENLALFNSVMGSYNRHGLYKSQPRSAAIPIGTLVFGRFNRLADIGVRDAITDALRIIQELINTGRYERVLFPATTSGSRGRIQFAMLGGRERECMRSGRFHIPEEIAAFITQALFAMGRRLE